jgi:formylglycine-generating enzyme required for sulfatase activity/predicted phosphodiesterase
MPVTWLHISDLHLVSPESSETFITERTRNLENLCTFVREKKEEGIWQPDLIFVTGDITNRGSEAVFTVTDSKPAPASLFFDKLLDAAGLEKERLFIVPGNHEVNRNAMQGSGLKPTLDDSDELEKHFSRNVPSPYITTKLGAFASWYNDYFNGIRTVTDRSTCLSEQVEIDGQRVSLLLMNSAVFCDDSTTDSGKLLIGQGCLDFCIQKLSVLERSDLTIGMIHHPLSFLAPFEQTSIRETLKRHLDILLRGHTHETEVHEGKFLEIAAGAAGEKSPWPRRATYGQLEGRNVTLFPLCNSERPHWTWTLDTSVFPEYAASGYCRTIPLDRYGAGASVIPSHEEEWERYRLCLKRELGYLRLFGLPRGFESVDVNLNDDSFVTLSISWQNDPSRMPEDEREQMQHNRDDILKPSELMIRAFREGDRRMLLVLGDAGTGKTTLMQYYALSVLDHKRARNFGFDVPVRVFFLQLRALHQYDGLYESLPESLHRWASEHGCQIDAPVFDTWLQSGPSLVLLDGLDEIIGLEERRKACQWIDTQWRNESFGKARFIVTTRRTGYLDLEIQASCYKAFVNDFSDDQQREFLRKWYYSAHFRPVQSKKESENQDYLLYAQKEADTFSGKIIDHLTDELYKKSLKPLAAIPMVLQMMALLWYREHDLPKTREQLYRGLFDYLVSKRDDSREILQSGSALSRMGPDRFRKVLGTLALWMFSDENQGGEQVRSGDLQELFRKALKALRRREFEPPTVKELCDHLLNRAELLTVNDLQSSYAFRHKSIREYLAGSRLRTVNLRQESCFDPVINRFSDPSWEETIRFFISGLDSFQFDCFMSRLFDPSVKPSFSQREKLLLKLLIEESPDRTTDALCMRLLTPKKMETGFDADRQMRQFMILDALAAIGDQAPVEILQRFLQEGYAEFDDYECLDRQKVESRAREVLVELGGVVRSDGRAKQDDSAGVRIVREGKTTLFRNPLELMAEYLLIPGKGTLVPDAFFARYPVTNRLYRRFIDYLQKKNPEYNALFPESEFNNVLQKIAKNRTWDTGFAEYLKEGKYDLAVLFRSREEDDRKFGGDDQPVVSITWYAARSYCLWLSLMESQGQRTDLYRLPTEREWEWAAAGKEKRKYPWGNAEPTPKLANYDKSNIGATTPVGSYPEGATPEGLYDMAGNVWEWQENWYGHNDYPDVRALRGGSWDVSTEYLCCSSRYFSLPVGWSYFVGFRVVRPSLPVEP